MLRDFIYLDAERIRSFSAQVLEGVPESETRESGRQVGGKVAAEAGLLSFLRGQGEADLRYHRVASETRSLHHHVYTLFEQSLVERDLLKIVDKNFDFSTWSSRVFSEGEFVKIFGAVRTMDYAETVARMELLPKLMKSLELVQSQNIKQEQADGTIDAAAAQAKKRELSQLSGEIKKLPVRDIASLGRELYAEGQVRVKIRPSGAPSEVIFVGTGRREGFLELAGAAAVMHESPPGSQWVAVGQVSSAPKAGALGAMPTGNQMEDAIEQVAISLNEIVDVGSSAVFPAMAITPLAIYRQIGLPD